MHPFIPFLASNILIASVPPFLPPSSAYRPFIEALILITCAISLRNIDYDAWWGEHFGMYVCGFGLHTNYFINLRRLTPPPGISRVQKVKWALKCSLNPRSEIATQDLPPFRVGDPQYIPTKADFLSQRTWTAVWTMGGFLFFQNRRLGLDLDDFQSPKHQIIRRLTDVSRREWLILLQIAFTGWFKPYAFFTAIHSMASIFAVAWGDAPENWRPLFGRIQEAYTLQRFFGVFWHRLMRKAFTGHASFLIYDVVGMSRGTAISRHAIVLTAFLISGVMHAIVSPISLSCDAPWQVAYYCCVGATIALENIAQQIYCHYQTAAGGKEVDDRKAYWRIAGYLWVTFFHLWSTAKFVYSPVQCMYGST